MTASRLIRRWSSACLGALGGLAFPLECVLCGGEGGPICDGCRGELVGGAGAACRRCARPLGPWESDEGGCVECRGRALGFDGAIALGPYRGPIRHLCLRLKRRRDAWLAAWVAEVLVAARGERLREHTGARVAAVPLHWSRLWRRGYDQADALARQVARRLGLRRVHPLQRVRATPPLRHLGRVERAEVLRGAFRARGGAAIAGRTVLLVDDILTTGATCGAAARALKRAGAARVVAVVVGRAGGDA
jgi:ComF family protein